jgi:hypothetical protein
VSKHNHHVTFLLPKAVAPLDEADRMGLQAMLGRMHEDEAVRRIGVSRVTVYRGLAGLPLQPGSRMLITMAIRAESE